MKYLLLLLLINYAHSYEIISHKKNSNEVHDKISEIVVNQIYDEIFSRSKKFLNQPNKVVKKTTKKSFNDGRRGRMIIEQMLQRNRERLALMRGVDPSKVKSGSDIVNAQKKDNKEILKKIKTLDASSKKELELLKRKVIVEHRAWKRKHLPTLKEWEAKRKVYFKKINIYKNNLIDIPLVVPVSKKDLNKKTKVKLKKDYSIVSSSLAIPVKDQKQRPTCSAFSGVRAIEVLLYQNDKKLDLSEQYFYWASKGKCRFRKCSQRGSWVGYGYDYGIKSRFPDIPLEKNCEYNEKNLSNNQTQIPLENTCKSGVAKVEKYTHLNSISELINAVDQNKSVVLGLKLTPNFYKNKGLVLDSESNRGPIMNSHAQGHAVLALGYLKLPKVLAEGRVCILINNSWGIGWGHGGYSCLSEKWIQKNRSKNAFIAIDKVKI